MSTKIECTTCSDATIGLDGTDPNRVDGEFYIFMGEEGHYVLRADFLAAVETECGGKFVPTPEPLADDMVHDLTTAMHAGSHLAITPTGCHLVDPLAHPATPPVDETDVAALAVVIADIVQPGAVPGSGVRADVTSESLARRLLATGRVSVTK